MPVCGMRLSAALLVLTAISSSASGEVFDDNTVQRIVGSEIREDEVAAAVDEEQVVVAIENTSENVGKVRKTTSVEQVDIVFLSDATPAEGGPPRKLAKALETHKADITRLQQEIEGNALLFHAINSRRLLDSDLLAMEFRPSGGVIIYAAAKPPG